MLLILNDLLDMKVVIVSLPLASHTHNMFCLIYFSVNSMAIHVYKELTNRQCEKAVCCKSDVAFCLGQETL